jgi:hypothetical protein
MGVKGIGVRDKYLMNRGKGIRVEGIGVKGDMS